MNKQERFNEKMDWILIILKILGLLVLVIFILYPLDYYGKDEEQGYFCEKKYGEEFIYKWDDFPYCVKITPNKTLIKYYFNYEDTKEYCINKFWKLEDCDNGLFK